MREEKRQKCVGKINTYFINLIYGYLLVFFKLRGKISLNDDEITYIRRTADLIIEDLKKKLQLNFQEREILSNQLAQKLNLLKFCRDRALLIDEEEYYISYTTIKRIMTERSEIKKIQMSIKENLSLQDRIEYLYQNKKATYENNEKIKVTKLRLEIAFKSFNCEEFQLFYYGSSVNGLMTRDNSDLDVTIFFKNQVNHLSILKKLEKMLKDLPDYYSKVELLPITRLYLLRMIDKTTGVKIDLCVNNILGVLNSYLLSQYCMFDERYIKLCIYIKELNKKKFPNEMQRLTSYSFYLMLLVFFQSHTQPPILPKLQHNKLQITYDVQYRDFNNTHFNSQSTQDSSYSSKNRPQKQFCDIQFTLTTNAGITDYEQFKSQNPEWFQRKNEEKESRLLRLFMKFLEKVSQSEYAFDVPNAKLTRKSEINHIYNQNTDKHNMPSLHPLYIIDPFDLNHNPGKKVKKGSDLQSSYLQLFKIIQNDK